MAGGAVVTPAWLYDGAIVVYEVPYDAPKPAVARASRKSDGSVTGFRVLGQSFRLDGTCAVVPFVTLREPS